MLAGVILPARVDDMTVDEIVSRAIASGMVACNAMTGPFRIAFFPKNRVPKGWSRIGFAVKTHPQEAA